MKLLKDFNKETTIEMLEQEYQKLDKAISHIFTYNPNVVDPQDFHKSLRNFHKSLRDLIQARKLVLETMKFIQENQ